MKTKQYSERLLFLGILLFLSGLLVAFFIPIMANPRIGLSAHLEGTMNGMFLLILGLIWNKLVLKDKWLTVTFWLTVYGTFSNFIAVGNCGNNGSRKNDARRRWKRRCLGS